MRRKQEIKRCLPPQPSPRADLRSPGARNEGLRKVACLGRGGNLEPLPSALQTVPSVLRSLFLWDLPVRRGLGPLPAHSELPAPSQQFEELKRMPILVQRDQKKPEK